MATSDVLGSGVNTAAIYSRNGKNRLAVLGGIASTDPGSQGITTLEWQRRHNDVSAAFVDIAGTPAGLRRTDLDRIHTWAHTLVMFRDGRRCWEGPIRTVDRSNGLLHIDAVDVAGWMGKRAIHRKRKTKKKQEVNVLSEMALDVRRAFHYDDPYVLTHMQQLHTSNASTTTRDVGVWSGYYLDDLKALVEEGGNFTVLGRSIILWPDQRVLAKLLPLDGDRFIVGDLHVIEAGDDLWTRTTPINGQGRYASRRATGGDVDTDGVSTYYGQHDRRVDAGVKTRAALARKASRMEKRSYPPPVVLTVADGGQLDPETPIPIEQLVTGVTIPVSTRLTGYRVQQSQILDQLTVHASSEGETVTVTLTNPAADTIEETT